MKKLSLLATLFILSCQPAKQTLTIKENLPEITKNSPSLSQSTFTPAATIQPQPELPNHELATPTIVKKKIQIGLLLPLSGKQKDLGQALANAATMSLFENDLNSNIELVFIDTKETPEEAKKAFDELLNRKIKIAIGPVFSSSVEAIAKDAVQNKITLISLSNNQELSRKISNEGGVFLAGIMPEAQIDKIVNYSLDQGKQNFAIISPNNQYGNTVTTIFKKIVKTREGNFITAEFYKNSDDIDRVVNRVITSFAISPALKAKKGAVINESDRSYPQVIFIPESGKILSKITASLKRQNVDERNFQIAGTNQWDDISTLNDKNLIGGWFAAPQNEKFRNFEKVYYQNFGKFPPRISSIAYDSVLAISNLLAANNFQEPKLSDFINYQPAPKNGFEGIDGQFRFLPNGLVQRNLAILKIANGRFEVIDQPAPQFLRY